jgi:integrase
MRLGEQLRMKRSQVDFLRNIVTARKTKNGRPRDIPMNDEVRETLAELCKDKRSDDYVFVSPKNDDERQREVKKGFHTACRLAGIEGLIWKDLRATFSTRLAEAGCDAFTIAQLLGHSDVRVTMRYVRSVEETKRVAVEAIKLSSRSSSLHIPAVVFEQSFACPRNRSVIFFGSTSRPLFSFAEIMKNNNPFGIGVFIDRD